jgi:hypothetical protein
MQSRNYISAEMETETLGNSLAYFQHGTCPVCRTRLGSSTDRRTDQQSAAIQSDSTSSLSSVAFFEPISDNGEGDVVASILDDVTDTLLTRTLPGSRESNDSLTFHPALDDLPLSMSRSSNPVCDVAANVQTGQPDNVRSGSRNGIE